MLLLQRLQVIFYGQISSIRNCHRGLTTYCELTRYWLVCSSTSKTLFVPVNESVTYKHFTTVINQYTEMQAKEDGPASVTYAQLQGMKRAELQAWLKAKGYTGQIATLPPKRKLVSLAKGVQDYPRRPQDPEAERRLQEVLNQQSNLIQSGQSTPDSIYEESAGLGQEEQFR